MDYTGCMDLTWVDTVHDLPHISLPPSFSAVEQAHNILLQQKGQDPSFVSIFSYMVHCTISLAQTSGVSINSGW